MRDHGKHGILIAPFAFYLLVLWYRQNGHLPTGKRLKHLLIPFGLGALLLAAYYVPYLLSLPDFIKAYWLERVTGEGDIHKTSRSSLYNFQVYNPLLAIYLYPLLGAVSLVKIKKFVPLLLWFAVPWLFLELAIFDPGTHIYTYLLPAFIMIAFGLEALEIQHVGSTAIPGILAKPIIDIALIVPLLQKARRYKKKLKEIGLACFLDFKMIATW